MDKANRNCGYDSSIFNNAKKNVKLFLVKKFPT